MLKYFIEIQNKLILLSIVFFSTLFVSYWYKNLLLFLITQMHLNDETFYFIFTDVTELFHVCFKIVYFISIQTVIWYFIYYLICFLRPALYLLEFQSMLYLFVSSTFFWFLAGLLSSYVIIPFSWNFFSSFQIYEGFYFEARIDEYFLFFTNIYFICLVYCQLISLIFMFLADIQKNYLYVKRYRKLYYYLFLLFATLLTPPDLMSQILVTITLVTAYEFTILILLFNHFYTKFNPVRDLN